MSQSTNIYSRRRKARDGRVVVARQSWVIGHPVVVLEGSGETRRFGSLASFTDNQVP